MDLLVKLLILCPLLFVAGLVDGISGGGGLIALPSYLIAGVPITSAYACNKMQSCLGTSASMLKYAKSGLLDYKVAFHAAVAAIIGAAVSTGIMLMLDDSAKKIIIAVSMCLVILLTVLSSRIKIDSYSLRRNMLSFKTVFLCLLIGLLLGFYDGFFGPGGGTIAVLLFALLMKYDLRVGCGNGKLVIVIANLTSTIRYIVEGAVIFKIAIPCSIANILGSYIGATLATQKGAKFVKYISWIVIAALLIYAIIETIS